MSGSRFLSSISLIALAACGSDDGATCGPADAPADGITLSGGGLEIRYENLIAGPNNDCPDLADPDAPTSVTIVGTQAGTGAPLVLCLARPDRFGATPTAFGTLVVVEDADGVAGGCELGTDKTLARPTGTASAAGYCDGGLDPAGFALVVDAEVDVMVTCGGVAEVRRLRLAGRAAVAAD